MESKRPPNKLSDNELLDILNRTSLEDKDRIKIEDSSDNDILRFISFYEIEEGKHFVSSSLMYKLYKAWSRGMSLSSQFGHQFSQYFSKYQIGLSYGYLLNIDKLKVSKQLFNYLNADSKIQKTVRKTHVANFIKKYGIKRGTFEIDLHSLYYLYDKWTYSYKKKVPLSKFVFFNVMKLFLSTNPLTGHNKTYFLIDETILNYITREEIERIQKGALVKYAREKKRNKTT
jgi:hypothetical protein